MFSRSSGVGKTVAKSIANATNRKFSRMSLGGVRDEAEVGTWKLCWSYTWRFAYILKKQGKQPLVLLDEIDKLGRDTRGNVADA